MHCFVFGSRTFGGHEMMAARIVNQVLDAGGLARILSTPAQIEQLRSRLRPSAEFVLLRHSERRLESMPGWLNPRVYTASRELQAALHGCQTLTMVNGGLTANHALTLAASCAARRAGAQAWIYFPMLHDTDELGLQGLRAASYRRAQNRVAAAFDHFVTIDALWRERLLARAERSLDVRIIHNHLDVPPAELAAPVAHGPPRLCFAGRFDRHQKGIDLLIETFDHLRNHPAATPMQWVFIGTGPYEQELRQACERMSGGPLSFEFHGWQSSAIKLMSDCQALVLPSRLEGVPTVVAEALTLGLRVFAYAIPGADRMLSDTPLIAPFDTRAMAEAIVQHWATPRIAATPTTNVYLHMLRDGARFRREVLDVYRGATSTEETHA